MISPNNRAWTVSCAEQAEQAGHIFSLMAACEAALESAFGGSTLAREDNNLFGMKQHSHSTLPSVSLPTKEYLDDHWVAISANFVKYPTLADCFADRMATLRRLQTVYPHYATALSAIDAKTYVLEVSKSWSTDPQRGAKCIAIYDEAFPPTNAEDVAEIGSGN